MGYLQVHEPNLFEEWPLLLWQVSCFHMQSINLTGSLHGDVPWLWPSFGIPGMWPQIFQLWNVNLIILWNVALVSCWGHKSQPRALPALAQSFCPWQDGGQRGSPTHREVPRSLFKKRNQPLEESLMEGALPRATPTVTENTYDAIPWQIKIWVKYL